ncbi:uncharacterized protein METZ01_LOCUS289313, partial [marine metagenome]
MGPPGRIKTAGASLNRLPDSLKHGQRDGDIRLLSKYRQLQRRSNSHAIATEDTNSMIALSSFGKSAQRSA